MLHFVRLRTPIHVGLEYARGCPREEETRIAVSGPKALLAGLIGNSALLGFGLVHALPPQIPCRQGLSCSPDRTVRVAMRSEKRVIARIHRPCLSDLVQQIPHREPRRVPCRRDCLWPPRHARLCVGPARRSGHHTISAKRPAQAAPALSTVEHTINVTKAYSCVAFTKRAILSNQLDGCVQQFWAQTTASSRPQVSFLAWLQLGVPE